MILAIHDSYLVLLCAVSIFIVGPTVCHGSNKVLYVGRELWKETMPLQSGSQLYQIEGLKSHTWYEVKISYPASIPAIFSLRLWHRRNDLNRNHIRRLLNTEKLIFKTDNLETVDKDGLYVLVTVEPEGIVAMENVEGMEYIVYNIVCDELLLGIPYKAWLVVALVLLCLIVSLIIPCYLPSHLFPDKRTSQRMSRSVVKYS